MLRLRTQTVTLIFGLQNWHARTSSAVATTALVGIAALSALLYWLGFVRPFPLLELYQQPLLDLYKLSSLKPTANWLLVSVFIVQGVLYWLAWRAAQRAHGWPAWIIVTLGALIFAGVFMWMYPFDAADIFDNIMHGRVLGVYGANPFLHPPGDFPGDPFLPYVAWKRTVSGYGPGWEALAGLVARLAGDGIVANVVAFKTLSGLFLLASIAIIALILRHTAPERALAGVVLLGWNPVILYETFGNGHNDMAMIFWVLAAVALLIRRRFTLAILALVIGALFKYIPLLMLPAAGLVALRELPTQRSRASFLVITTLATTTVICLAYWPFWSGLEVLTIQRRTQLFTTSLPATVQALLSPWLDNVVAGHYISLVAAACTAIYALWQGVQAWRDRTWLSFPRAAFLILTFYLLFTCLWFQQWYVVWPLGLAALLPPGHAARLAALFGFAALSKQLLVEPLITWARPIPSKPWRELRLGPTILALPWLYVLCWWATNYRRRTTDDGQPSRPEAPATDNRHTLWTPTIDQ